jgi:hypothetical protein
MKPFALKTVSVAGSGNLVNFCTMLKFLGRFKLSTLVQITLYGKRTRPP